MYKILPDTQAQQARNELLDAAILTTGAGGTFDDKIIPISSIKTFLNTRSTGSAIPTDGPLPDHLVPLVISRHFDPQSLCSALGWRELSIKEWLQFILEPHTIMVNIEHDITRSPQWAERVLQVLARVWPSCAGDTQADIVALLKEKTCIPTSTGMRRPEDAYFQNAHVFPDLPLVALPSGALIKGNLDKVLQSLGVRKHVELQIVFNRWAIFTYVQCLYSFCLQDD